MTDVGFAALTMRRGKWLYIHHEVLHLIHYRRFLDQLGIEVREVVIHVSEMINENCYIPIFLLGFIYHSNLPNILANK